MKKICLTDFCKNPVEDTYWCDDCVQKIPAIQRRSILQNGGNNSTDTSPKHYRQGTIEPWDFITSQGMSFLEGNIVKYVTRYKAKGGVADLLKAKTCLEKLIKEVIKCENSKD